MGSGPFPRQPAGVSSMRHRSGTKKPRLTALVVILLPSIVSGLAVSAPGAGESRPAAEKPLGVIVFGAHPDDCELSAGGTAARWVKLGNKVKFVSVTNGNIGHHQMAGAILARRRTAEVKLLRRDPGDRDRSPRHSRRRADADPGKPPHDHSQDSRVASRRRHLSSPQRFFRSSSRQSSASNAARTTTSRLTQRHGEGAWHQVA